MVKHIGARELSDGMAKLIYERKKFHIFSLRKKYENEVWHTPTNKNPISVRVLQKTPDIEVIKAI